MRSQSVWQRLDLSNVDPTDLALAAVGALLVGLQEPCAPLRLDLTQREVGKMLRDSAAQQRAAQQASGRGRVEPQRLAGERGGLCVEDRLITQGVETAARIQVRAPERKIHELRLVRAKVVD